MKVLIVYYSTYGNVYKMAKFVAEGVKEIKGAEPLVRRVPELIPSSVIDSREDMKAGREMQKDVPLVTKDDFKEATSNSFWHANQVWKCISAIKKPDRSTHIVMACR